MRGLGWAVTEWHAGITESGADEPTKYAGENFAVTVRTFDDDGILYATFGAKNDDAAERAFVALQNAYGVTSSEYWDGDEWMPYIG